MSSAAFLLSRRGLLEADADDPLSRDAPTRWRDGTTHLLFEPIGHLSRVSGLT